MLDCDQACEDLGIAGRTLDTALQSLGTWWRDESQRSAAARSGRDFHNSVQSFPPSTLAKIKPYAIVGSRAHARPRTLVIHRNYQRLDQILAHAGILQPNKVITLSETSALGHGVRGGLDVLESELQIGPAKRGIAWGWSEERRKATSERMTAKWLRWRELGLK
jgi:predicted transcriptional regulator